jgi:type II secretory ATPase GspE/PulE/Tfp pilus assembly ATPase PilB-like protein
MEQNQAYVLTSNGRPANAIQAADFILLSAINKGASDIHLGTHSSGEAPLLVRFRTHGRLLLINAAFLFPIYKEVMARIKVLAGLNMTEVGVPQEGYANVVTPTGPAVLRVSSIPGPQGEEMVIRVQKGMPDEQTIANMGMTQDHLAQLESLIFQKSGLVIINGPASSGKTQTIYSILRTLATPEKKILTAEDPIEGQIPWVSHLPVTRKTSFGMLARSFVRQDPDVVFIGEVRDEESALTTVQLAQTGNLVLTTLHTRDSVGVISRLISFGVASNFVAGTLIGSLAQRLVPALCAACRVAYTPEPATAEFLHSLYPIPQDATFFTGGPGCERCVGGYSGRRAVFEMLTLDSELSEMVERQCTQTDIFQIAKQKGLKTLVEDMLDSVYSGFVDLNSVRGYLLAARPR